MEIRINPINATPQQIIVSCIKKGIRYTIPINTEKKTKAAIRLPKASVS
jgi:hypothetical protein